MLEVSLFRVSSEVDRTATGLGSFRSPSPREVRAVNLLWTIPVKYTQVWLKALVVMVPITCVAV